MADHILLLAGTFEARQIAGELARTYPEMRLTVSFAGVVLDLPGLGLPTRIGGFGGANGFADYLRTENVGLVIDATHPFAAQMSTNAVKACDINGIPLIRLERPAWAASPGDNWQHVGSMADAAAALPAGARAFLAVGRKEVFRFAERADIYGLARMIEAPVAALPEHWDLVLARPPATADAEIDMLRAHAISLVVSKNSGGTRSYAKIEAARRLELPVIMIDRPNLPETITAPDKTTVLALVKTLLSQS